MTEQFDVLSETIFVSIIQQELDSISPPAVQYFVDYYNSSRGFTPRRQPCKQWKQLWIYPPLKIKTQRWGRVMLMSLCVPGLISGELFHFIYCVPRARYIKMIKVWLKLFHFASHALSIFEHNMAPSLTWAWEHRIAWISTKSFKKRCCWVGGFWKKNMPLSFRHFCWWSDSCLQPDGSQLAMSNVITGGSLQIHTQYILPTDQSRLKKINEAIWKAMERSS